MTLVVVDIETVGSAAKRHGIRQLAAVAVDDQWNTLEEFNADIICSSLEYGTSNRRSKRDREPAPGARQPHDVGSDFAAFLKRHPSAERVSQKGHLYTLTTLAAYNAARWDERFLHTWYERLGLFCPAEYGMLCIYQRVRWWFREHPDVTVPERYDLSTMCEFFGIPLGAQAHTALPDARAAVQLARLVGLPVRLVA